MNKSFRIVMMTPGEKVYEGEALSLRVPATMGSMGVLAGHVPFISGLVPGRIVVREPEASAPVVFQLSGKGILDVSREAVTILVYEDQGVVPRKNF
jgi:F0F1-type ATP synthase epsilon subunit